jgi:hypothetical protein
MQKISCRNGRPSANARFLLGFLVALFSSDAHADVYNETRPILEIKNGKLQGVEEHGMFAFRNIPYAAPPVGELRAGDRRSRRKTGKVFATQAASVRLVPNRWSRG